MLRIPSASVAILSLAIGGLVRDGRLAAGPTLAMEQAGNPVAVFADLDGVWLGTFVGYDQTGDELYRIRVRQEYSTVDANTQTVRVRDTMEDGTVITGEGKNTAHESEDGNLKLQCVVRKSNGETVHHDGRLAKGPTDDSQLVWYSSEKGKVETFREWVEPDEEGNPAVYHIQGMGLYGDTLILMAGRYERQPADDGR